MATNSMKIDLTEESDELEITMAIVNESRRRRLIDGKTAESDDEHKQGQLAMAAAVYAIPENRRPICPWGRDLVSYWPFHAKEWYPTPEDREFELVRAGSLIVAEIKRLRRKRRADHQESMEFKRRRNA